MNLQIFLLSMFLFYANNLIAQQEYDISRIEFATSTRGYHKNVVVTLHAIKINEQAKGEDDEIIIDKKISSDQWEQLTNALHGVSLTEIPSLKSPTMKRAFDGARASTITITNSKGEIFSHSFDNEDPNEKLELLMRALSSLEK
jgi:hypothetical protein